MIYRKIIILNGKFVNTNNVIGVRKAAKGTGFNRVSSIKECFESLFPDYSALGVRSRSCLLLINPKMLASYVVRATGGSLVEPGYQ